MRQGVLWTNLSLRELSRRLGAMGTPAGRRAIRRSLRRLKMGRRTAQKKKTMGHHPDRDAQFQNITQLRHAYQAAGDPVISVDTKKKELLGNFHRAGQTYTQQTVETLDHDFPSAGHGKLIPHGIYDLANNHAAVHLNTSHDTGELCCDSIALWWAEHGRAAYGLCVAFNDQNAAFPLAKVRKQFDNGIDGGDGIYSFFTAIPLLFRL